MECLAFQRGQEIESVSFSNENRYFIPVFTNPYIESSFPDAVSIFSLSLFGIFFQEFILHVGRHKLIGSELHGESRAATRDG